MKCKILCLSVVLIVLSTVAFSKEEIVKINSHYQHLNDWKKTHTRLRGKKTWNNPNPKIPTFYVYTVDEINDKFSKLRGDVRSDYNEQVAGFKSVRAKVEELRSNVKSDYEESKTNFRRIDQRTDQLETKLEAIDQKFESSIEELPSIMTHEILPQVKKRLEDDPEFKQAISTHVMNQLFEEIERLNARIKKLEDGAST